MGPSPLSVERSIPSAAFRIVTLVDGHTAVHRMTVYQSYGIATHTGIQLISSYVVDGNSVIPSFEDRLWDELSLLLQARAAVRRALSS
jgi:hypothetical protein